MRQLWAILAFQLAILSPFELVASKATDFVRPQVRVTTTFADFDARIMDHWGKGGGKWVKISKDSKHPFEGRTFGGAKRKEIRGTRAFGSGYPYGVGNQSTIARRPFPFGVWPLYWDQDFMDSSEYGPQYDAIRPGGLIVYVPLRTTKDHFNVTEDEVYYAVGDRESLLMTMVSYVTYCHVMPAWPSKFDPTSPNSTIKLENVIQYFRASSFALASPAYNNTLARTSNSQSTDSSPLPSFIEYSPFRKCVDGVTENALAIMNQPPNHSLEGTLIAVFCSTWLIHIFIIFYFIVGVYYVLQWMKEQLWAGPFGYLQRLKKKWFPDPEIQRRQMEAIRAERQLEMTYESYP